MVVTLPRLPDSRDIFNPVQSSGGPSLVATTRDGMQLMLFDFDSQKWSELLHMNVARSIGQPMGSTSIST